MARTLNTSYGKVHLFKNNPREIHDSAFNRLVESVENKPQFMTAQKIVIWKCPEELQVDSEEKCPFQGQEGELIIIAGNQRAKSLMALGKSEIPDEWVVEAKDSDGEWWNWRDAELFVNLSNSPEGISGEFDYKILFEKFGEMSLRLAGIDFASFSDMIDESNREMEFDPSKAAEEGEHGEKSPELQEFIAHREETRKNLKEIDETGFHLLLVFDDLEQRCEFISKAGLTGKNGRVSVNGTNYVDLVFETYDQKMSFARQAGLLQDEEDEEDGHILYGMFADGRFLAKKMGIELKESGLHFRDRKIDAQLADMAMEETPQKTFKEQDTELYEEIASQEVSGDER